MLESRHVRDSVIDRDYVLDRIKVLALLPDDKHATVSMVAQFYDVGENVIHRALYRHKDEFDRDGVRTITPKDDAFDTVSKALMPKQFIVKLIPRRAVLRIGMLLRDSAVAKAVRTYLLNVEQIAPMEQRTIARIKKTPQPQHSGSGRLYQLRTWFQSIQYLRQLIACDVIRTVELSIGITNHQSSHLYVILR